MTLSYTETTIVWANNEEDAIEEAKECCDFDDLEAEVEEIKGRNQ